MLLTCRLILGVAEGIYWPQQARFAKAWFASEAWRIVLDRWPGRASFAQG